MELALLTYSQGSYQPLLRAGQFSGADPRSCDTRWRIIEPHLPSDARTAIDLGCSYGYFCLKLAERGMTTLGVDNLAPTLDVAWRQARLNGRQRVGFINDTISHEFVDRLPVFDVVIFFSLMHHLMYLNDVAWARELLRRLRPKIGKAMFFDMGHSREPGHEWSRLLPDMGPDPDAWIVRFLAENGFPRSRIIGHAPADKNDSPDVMRAVIHAC